MKFSNQVNVTRESCLIEEEADTFLLTGGAWSKTKVSRYNKDSHVEDIGDLNTGRWRHACGWFLDSAGNRVSFVYLLTDKQIEKNCYFR